MKVVGSTKIMVGGGGDVGNGGIFGGGSNGTRPMTRTASEASSGNLIAMVSAIFVMVMHL